MFAGQVAEEPVLRRESAGLFAQWRAAIADLVRRAAPGSDPDGVSAALLAAVQGGTLLANLQGVEDPLVGALDAVLAELR